MADAVICVKDPNEDLKNFNARLRQKCMEAPVTDFELYVVDAQPVVALMAGVVEADEEDVEDAKEAGETIKLGALIPEDDPILVQVCPISALVPAELDKDGSPVRGKEGDAATSERRLDKLCERAEDRVIKVRLVSGTSYGYVQSLTDPKKKEWLPITKNWVAIASTVPESEPAGVPAPAPSSQEP